LVSQSALSTKAHGAAVRAGLQEPRQLRAYAVHVGLEVLGAQQLALDRFPARIADQSGAAADEPRWSVTETLKPLQDHDGHEGPTWRLEAVGSKPMYAVTFSRASSSRAPSVALATCPRHSKFPKQIAH